MRLGEIDLQKELPETKLYLCRPDTEVISPLRDIGDVTITHHLGEVGELEFTVPSRVERNRELVDNPLLDKIKSRYLVKAVSDEQVEYFILLDENKSFDNSSESVTHKAYSRGYMLADKTVKSFLEESKTLSEIAGELLSITNWKVGYVDSSFDLMHRTFEAPSETVLEAIYNLAERFGAVIVWDTIMLTVNFHQPSNVGANRGLRFKEGKYLESFSSDSNARDAATRLRVYGAEGLTFRNLTPTGVNYLEDFSWYMHPFEMDEDGNILSRSEFMSTELCIALTNYTNALESVEGEFESMLEKLSAKQREIQSREQELTSLKADLAQALDSIDVSNSNGDSDTPEHELLVTNKNNVEQSIESKEQEIEALQDELKAIQEDMDELRATIKIETYLSGELLIELNDFVIEKEFTNDAIVDEEDLLQEGFKRFNEIRVPPVSITMELANFLSVVESQNDWDKLRMGDIVKLESKRLRTGVELRIIEIKHDIEGNSISVTVSNEEKLKNDYDKMIDEIYKSSSTSNVVNMDRYKWNMAEDAKDGVSNILNNAWDATQQGIQAGYKQMLDITERGIFVRSPEDPDNLLVLQNGVLGLSNNGGDNWSLAITPQGVFAERLVGRILLGNKLVIEDEEGIIEMVGSKQTIYDPEGNEKVVLGRYDDDQYGIKINGGAIDIVGGLTEDNISPEYTEGVKYDDSGLRQDLRLTAPLPNDITLNSSGITASTSDSNSFARLDYRGLYIQGGAVDIRTSASSSRGVTFDSNGISGYNASGTRTFHLDTNGNLTANRGTFGGRLDGASGTFSGNLSAAGGTFSGNLTAASGTFTGTLRGVDGTFTNLSSGTITGAMITGSEIESVDSNNSIRIKGGELVSSGLGGFYKTAISEGGLIISDNQGASLDFSLHNSLPTIKSYENVSSGTRGSLSLDADVSISGNLTVAGSHNIVAKFG